MRPFVILAALAGLEATTAMGCSQDAAAPSRGPTLAVTVAPLDVPGLSDACYELTVWNRSDPDSADAAVVWSKDGLCASRYGAEGGIRFTGICDASAPGDDHANAIRLVLRDVYAGGAGDTSTPVGEPLAAGTDYVNPCPAPAPGSADNGCVLVAPCEVNADSAVTFDLTVMRQASIGFFDTVVKFEDLFCAAKLDCVDDHGAALDYLPDPTTGHDGPTAVLGFTCVSGDPAKPVSLYLDDVVVTCTKAGVTRVARVSPLDGPGRVTPTQDGATTPPVLFAAQVDRGDAMQGGVYWNVLLGMGLAPGESCTLTTRGTASEVPLAGGATPLGARYPLLTWDVLLSVDGARVCTRHALGGGNGVATAYTPLDAPITFDHALDACPAGLACDDGVVATVDDTCLGTALGCRGTYCEGPTCTGTGASASGGPGELVSLEGASFTVPADGPVMSIVSTTLAAPSETSDGVPLAARSPVYELLPAGTTFSVPLPVSLGAGALGDVTVFTSQDGVAWEEVPDVTLAGGVATFAAAHFSYYVFGTNLCSGKAINAFCAPAPGTCTDPGYCQFAGSGCRARIWTIGTSCRPPAGPCDIGELCDGASKDCPLDRRTGNGVTCRVVAGPCDVAETCNGTAVTCPTDGKRPQGASCRAAVGTCDVAEVCNGTAVTCPDDAFAAAALACDDGSATTIHDACDGAGACIGKVDADGDGYDVTVDCDDTRAAVHPGATEVCGNHLDDDCDGTANGCDWTGVHDVSDCQAKVIGAGANHVLGYGFNRAGDVNSDGFADLGIGALHDATTANGHSGLGDKLGEVYVVDGRVSGHYVVSDPTGLGRTIGKYKSGVASDRFGTHFDFADLTGDGVLDLVVGAHRTKDATYASCVDGRIYAWAGPLAGSTFKTPATAFATMTGLGAFTSPVDGRLYCENDNLGYRVSAGDVTGDGVVDVIGGSGWPSQLASHNAAYVFAGPLSGALAATSARTKVNPSSGEATWAFQHVAWADLNGDGKGDLLLGNIGDDGAAADAGALYVFYGPVAAGTIDPAAADVIIRGPIAGALLGVVFGHYSTDDFNDDGYADLLVGAFGATYVGASAGAVYLFEGPLTGVLTTADADATWYGSTESGEAADAGTAGDFNGDGVTDVVIGSDGSNFGGSRRGAAYIYYGPVGGTYLLDDAHLILHGSADGDEVGFWVTGVGDGDGDGFDDLALTSPWDDEGGTDAGAVFVCRGTGL